MKCGNCDYEYNEHAMADNAYCSKLRCPGDNWPSQLKAGSNWPLSWPEAQKKMREFWNERQTTFVAQYG